MELGEKESFFLSDLFNFSIFDKNSENLGTVGDAIFKIDKNKIKIISLILFGSWLEEKLEDLGLKENIDPIIPLEYIVKRDSENKSFKLNIEKKEIATTHKNWKVPPGIFHYLSMKKLPVHDNNGKTLGRIIDIYFRPLGSHKFILGGSWLEEFLEDKGLIPDKDLILPISKITAFTNGAIKTNVIEEDLQTTLDMEFTFEVKHEDKVFTTPKGFAYEVFRHNENLKGGLGS